jgi:lysophospholipase L1-like esterase
MLKYLLILPLLVVLFVLLVGAEVLIAKGGPKLEFTNPPSVPAKLGAGTPLTYVVMGDSTAAGEGASSYKTGIADTTARYLARNHTVTYVNVAISGARTHDVLATQVQKAVSYKPDVVLLAIGANDVTHVTSSGSVKKSAQQIINQLIAANCNVKIVLTGSPDMGAVPRLLQPLRWLAGAKTNSLNATFGELVRDNKLTFAPIAAKTGSQFRQNHALFAADHFHPNDQGYATWMPVLEPALDAALENQPTHC